MTVSSELNLEHDILQHFKHKNGILYTEGVDIRQIANQVGTPFYCYSHAAFVHNFKEFSDAIATVSGQVFYSVKANSNQAVLDTLANLGAGMDVVSVGELKRARAVGVPGEKIVYAGVGKTEAELSYALEQKILLFNIESEPELRLLSKIATSKGVTASVSVRINPDIDAQTHAKITTGKAENKFGVPLESVDQMYQLAAELPGIEVKGIDLHIGSQITELAPFDLAFKLLSDKIVELKIQGYNIEFIDLGGGFGISYDTNSQPNSLVLNDYISVVNEHLGSLGCKIIFEPGRFIAGNAGILIACVIYVKKSRNHRFVIVDAAMNDFLRPTLYEAYHEIGPVVLSERSREQVLSHIVGPVCESGDYLAKGRKIEAMQAGELLAIYTTGAYGAVQSSTYTSRALIPEVMVKGTQFEVIRDRIVEEDLIKLDRVPTWELNV